MYDMMMFIMVFSLRNFVLRGNKNILLVMESLFARILSDRDERLI